MERGHEEREAATAALAWTGEDAEARAEAGDWSDADYIVLRLSIEYAQELEGVLEVEARARDSQELDVIHSALREAMP